MMDDQGNVTLTLTLSEGVKRRLEAPAQATGREE